MPSLFQSVVRLITTSVFVTLLVPSFAMAQDEAPASSEEESPDDYELPADLDDDYELPDDLDDDYALPDDSDDSEGGDDEWNFDEALEDADSPLVLPLFGETTFGFTSTTTAQYRFDNFNSNNYDDDFLSFWEKFEFYMQGEALRISARLDAFVPLFESECPEGQESFCFYETDVRLERFNVHYEDHGLTLDFVDSYVVLGRGIAFSLRRVDLLGVDSTIRGAQVAYDEGRFFTRAFGGSVNHQNLDPQTLQILDFPADQLRRDLFSHPRRRDWATGGEFGLRLGPVTLAGHAAHTWFAGRTEDTPVDIAVFGWRLDAPALLDGRLSLYGEVNGMRRVSKFFNDEVRDFGRAVYGALQYRMGNVALLLEWKDYDNFRVAPTNEEASLHRIYSASPTLERPQERPEALHNARGGRAQLDIGFQPSPWNVSFNFLGYGYAASSNTDPWDGILVTHGFAKLQRAPLATERVGWSLGLEVGYRRERYLETPIFSQDRIESGEVATVIHGLIEAGVVFGEHSFELLFRHRDERHFERTRYEEFVRGELSLTYSFAGRFRISPLLAWNTEGRAGDSPTIYGGLELRVDFLSGSFFRVFGGQTPGGLICSGGVCRDVPPFQGVTGELVIRL